MLNATRSASSWRIERQGVAAANITVWAKNGIEHYYPQDLVAKAFCCDVAQLSNEDLENDPIEVNRIRKSKKELARHVTEQLTAAHALHPELQALVNRIQAACR